ncbi:MAG: tetratricopeptide repeat protein [Phycisphaerae bacterium]|jgi:tetratricopeptide (TPR) repeat protein
MKKIPAQNRSLLIYLILSLTTLIVFYQVRLFPFVNYDDPVYVTHNANIQKGISFESVKWALTSGYAKNWHPLTWFTHILDWRLFGNNPAGPHIINLLFHILNTLLLFFVLKKMTNGFWQSAFAAAIFAVHPLHVESVAWISERKDVLSTFFWLLTMAAYLRYTQKQTIIHYLTVLFVFALGLMSKPMLVTLPFVLLLLDYWPLNRFTAKHSLLNPVTEKVPLFAMAAASSVITFIVQKGNEANLNEYDFPVRLANALISYQSYIMKTIWPGRLAIFYPHPGSNVSIPFAVISAIMLLVITFFVLKFSSRHKYLFTGWFWYIGTLVPVIGFVQVGDQAMADRYSYITLTGLFIIAAWGVPEILNKWKYKKATITLSAILAILVLSICTFFQLGFWRNNLTLFQHAIDITKNNYMAHYCMVDPLSKREKLNEAIYHCSMTTQLMPGYFQAHLTMSYLLQASGRYDEAVQECWKCLQMKPDEPNALNGIGVIFGIKNQLDEAVKYFKLAIKSHPNFVESHINLGYALTLQGKFDEAAVCFSEALRLDNRSAIAHYHLGCIFQQKDQLDEAINHFQHVISINPGFAEAKNKLNAALSAKQNSQR